MSSTKRMLITGSSGLIGSEAVQYFAERGYLVTGVDNNGRQDFFGPKGDTRPTLNRLLGTVPGFTHHSLDIRNRQGVLDLVADLRPDAIIHSAGQPSHDLAKSRPFDDFHTNAVGTLNLLEATRRAAAETPFVFLSTNKVYGDAPNELQLVELETRWEYASKEDYEGVDEHCRLDHCMHSLFGVSKASADLLVQEYGRAFDMPTVCFRAGCMTGPQHAGVELHGFLSYLAKTAVQDGRYTIFGYEGKQVRDQIHAHDVCSAIEAWIQDPSAAAVYNLGGGRRSHASVMECIHMLESLLGRGMRTSYDPVARAGDHICYISDTRLFQSRYPHWNLTRTLPDLLEEIVAAETARLEASEVVAI